MQQVRWRPDHWLLIGDDGRIAGAQPGEQTPGPGWQRSMTSAATC
jgi:guanine deaminase